MRDMARSANGSTSAATKSLLMSRVRYPAKLHSTKKPITPRYTISMLRVSAASSISSAPMKIRFGSTITPRPYRYGAGENGPTREGSSPDACAPRNIASPITR